MDNGGREREAGLRGIGIIMLEKRHGNLSKARREDRIDREETENMVREKNTNGLADEKQMKNGKVKGREKTDAGSKERGNCCMVVWLRRTPADVKQKGRLGSCEKEIDSAGNN